MTTTGSSMPGRRGVDGLVIGPVVFDAAPPRWRHYAERERDDGHL